MNKKSRAELLSKAEEIISNAEAEHRDAVNLPTELARAVLEIGKKSGRPRRSLRSRLFERRVMLAAHIRKRELVAEGKPLQEAIDIAAEEARVRLAAPRLKPRTRTPLGLQTIKDRMRRLK